MSLLPVSAGQLPSLFRGVVVADSPLGVRVVSVEESSQAFLADLRPEDIIFRVNESEVHSIDEFAALSLSLRGRAVSAAVLLFRNGTPHEIALHLYSYPLLRQWGIEFLPDHDVRFAQPEVGLDYWRRLGRGYEDAGKPDEALQAYLNGLHTVPTDVPTACTATTLLLQISRRRLTDGSLADGLTALDQAVAMMERLFDAPVTDEQLAVLKRELQDTLAALRGLKSRHLSSTLLMGRH